MPHPILHFPFCSLYFSYQHYITGRFRFASRLRKNEHTECEGWRFGAPSFRFRAAAPFGHRLTGLRLEELAVRVGVKVFRPRRGVTIMALGNLLGRRLRHLPSFGKRTHRLPSQPSETLEAKALWPLSKSAICSQVVVFPHHFAPSRTTAPADPTLSKRISSTILCL